MTKIEDAEVKITGQVQEDIGNKKYLIETMRQLNEALKSLTGLDKRTVRRGNIMNKINETVNCIGMLADRAISIIEKGD